MPSTNSGTPARAATHRRAVEAVMWGMPAVNYQMMYEASARAGGPGDNQIVYWPGLLDWHNQTLTPNPDVVYLMPFFNTKDVGPLVLEVPPVDPTSRGSTPPAACSMPPFRTTCASSRHWTASFRRSHSWNETGS